MSARQNSLGVRLRVDGETVTLHPSLGSWTLPCRSHHVW
ncbi:DUF6527 family protein [Sphingomonas sp. ac-8]